MIVWNTELPKPPADLKKGGVRLWVPGFPKLGPFEQIDGHIEAPTILKRYAIRSNAAYDFKIHSLWVAYSGGPGIAGYISVNGAFALDTPGAFFWTQQTPAGSIILPGGGLEHVVKRGDSLDIMVTAFGSPQPTDLVFSLTIVRT